MDEKIIKELLKKGYMVTPDTLKRIEQVGVDTFFSESGGGGTFLMERKQESSRPQTTLRVVIKKPGAKQKLKPPDIVKYYNNRYNNLRNILSGKIGAISINKTPSQFEASVIGMVKQVSPQGFSLEDPTGSIEVISKQKPDLDDVIGVRGIVREGVLQEKEIIYPDIPLNRKIVGIESSLSLSAETNDNKTQISVGKENPVKDTLKSLMWIAVDRGEGKINILVYKPKKETDIKAASLFLKKRHLYPKLRDITTEEDTFVIDPVPDYFWIIGNSRWMGIYRGVSVFSTQYTDNLTINLSTRELKFI